MEIVPLSIEGAWQITPKQHGDDRGLFLEWFKESVFTDVVGHGFELAQANCSVSSAGTLRGIHFADVPPGQAKYVTCLAGAVMDVIVDIRVGSPTFGEWTSVTLDAVDRRALYLSEGLGHGFVARADNSTVAYLCSEPYSPTGEHGVNPLDPELGINWRIPRDQMQLSAKDVAAPSWAEAVESGILPKYAECLSYRSGLAQG
jgi:dTDP-4-dehydrorhamnose 3,5-epimerase